MSTNFIEPIQSIAFSIHSNPGVYAILLGSGVSKGAGIPTGWDIVVDLIRRLSQLKGESCEPDPVAWYQETFGEEPDYSQLLSKLARTPSERQQILQSYFEPNDEEREEGLKQPTTAHYAIAELVSKGYIKVIVTTNFDRLLERALSEKGVEPDVLSSPERVEGAIPLVHSKCCILKIHGDYLDTRILNTPDELGEYPEGSNRLLDQILDEYGLVVCGWSADWDTALRNTFFRAPCRRFTTYWAAKGEPSEKAEQLINHRKAETVTIEDADSFFEEINALVGALEEFATPHPLSTAAAVASFKRYLSREGPPVQLADLIVQTVEQVVAATSGANFGLNDSPPASDAVIAARIRAYETSCATIMAMAAVGGRWAELDHVVPWQRALQRLSEYRPDNSDGYTDWLDLLSYPATLVLYALGLGAVEAERYEFIGELFSTRIPQREGEARSAVEVLPVQMGMPGIRRNPSLHEMLKESLAHSANGVINGQVRFTLVLQRLEILMALSRIFHSRVPPYEDPSIPFEISHETIDQMLTEMELSIKDYEEDSALASAEVFGSDPAWCLETIERFRAHISEMRPYMPYL